MSKYQQGKIYKIVNIASKDERDCYVGSTYNELHKRFGDHKSEWKNGHNPLRELFKAFTKYGIENFRIVLIEKYPCSSREELAAREEHHRATLKAKYNSCRAQAQKESYTPQDCRCGGRFTEFSKAKHEQTSIHRAWVSKVEWEKEREAYWQEKRKKENEEILTRGAESIIPKPSEPIDNNKQAH